MFIALEPKASGDDDDTLSDESTKEAKNTSDEGF